MNTKSRKTCWDLPAGVTGNVPIYGRKFEGPVQGAAALADDEDTKTMQIPDISSSSSEQNNPETSLVPVLFQGTAAEIEAEREHVIAMKKHMDEQELSMLLVESTRCRSIRGFYLGKPYRDSFSEEKAFEDKEREAWELEIQSFEGSDASGLLAARDAKGKVADKEPPPATAADEAECSTSCTVS